MSAMTLVLLHGAEGPDFQLMNVFRDNLSNYDCVVINYEPNQAWRLQDRGRFKPMLVWRCGNQYYVIDGNHRYLAYKAFGFHGDVPVRVVPDDMVAISNKIDKIK
jgi:hypothetical protein